MLLLCEKERDEMGILSGLFRSRDKPTDRTAGSSYLPAEEQEMVLSFMKSDEVSPSLAQARELTIQSIAA